MIRRQHVVRDFFTEPQAMREALDARFKRTYAHNMDWAYFCDPQLYTYLRTDPQSPSHELVRQLYAAATDLVHR